MIWRKFAAAVAGVVVMTGTALAAPRAMELTAETTVVNGKQRMSFTSKTQVKDSKMRVETLGGSIKGPDGQPLNSVMLVDPAAKVMYMLNDRNKSAMKVKLDQAASQLNLGASIAPDPKNVAAEMKKKGGKVIGQASLLGHPCEIWSVPYTGPDKVPTTAKIWLAKDLGLPLKMEVTKADNTQTMSLLVTKVNTSVTLADSLFQVPKDYKVTDMADLAKRMQQQGKPLPGHK